MPIDRMNTCRGLLAATALALVSPGIAQAAGPAFDIAAPASGLATADAPPTGAGIAEVRDPNLLSFPLAAPRLSLAGENPHETFAVFLTGSQSTRAASMVLSYVSAVSVAPETSMLRVLVNDVAVSEKPLQPGGAQQLVVPVPVGLLQPGFNSVRILLSQNHRVDCSIDGTYELWTQIDPRTSGFRFAAAPSGVGDISELPALPRDETGAVRIDGRLVAGATPAHIDRTLNAIQSAVLLGAFETPAVHLGTDSREGPGLDVAVGTFSELPDAPRTGNTAWPNVSFLPGRDGSRPRLVVSGATSDEVQAALAQLRNAAQSTKLMGTASGLRALENGRGRRIADGQSISLAEFGSDDRPFTGRFFRESMTLALPADFYAADYDYASILLDAAYAKGLSDNAQFITRANGRIVATLSLSSPRAGTIEKQRLRLPLDTLKPGLNTISFEAIVPRASDSVCDASAQQNASARFLLGGSSTLEMPSLARVGHYPDLSATMAGIGQQAPEIDRALAVYVPGADPSALDAAATIVAKMSIGSGTVRDTHMVSAMPHEESGNLLAVGAYAALPPELLDAVRIRSGSAEPSPADEPVQLGAWTSIEANAATGETAGEVAGVDPAMPVAGEGGILSSFTEPVDYKQRFVELTRPFVTSIASKLRREASSDPTRFTALPDEALLVAQAPAPRAAAAAWTLVAAPTTEALASGVRSLTGGDNWSALAGAVSVVSKTDGSITATPSSEERLFETQPRSIGNARLVLAGWFSRHAESYMILLLSASILLGVTTLVFLRGLGEKDR